MKSHGHTKGRSYTKIYTAWKAMKQRCTDPGHKDWHSYGGRGISFCDRWASFEAFFEDMSPRPDGSSLDRKNTNGDYCKDNCRWATNAQQSRNTRRNVMVTVGDKTLCVKDWSKHLGIVDSAIWTGAKVKRMSVGEYIARRLSGTLPRSGHGPAIRALPQGPAAL